jgi:phosphoadenosine phosphosulfate reductase
MRGLAIREHESSAGTEVTSIGMIVRLLRDEAAGTIEERSKKLEAFSETELIEGAITAFGKEAAVSTAFGPGGLCVMDIAQRFDPEVRAFYIDTGFAFPETERLLGQWIGKQKLNLLRVVPMITVDEQAKQHGNMLWMRDPDKCCEIRKVEPNNRALETVKLWIAALRRDESSTRKETPILQRIELPSGHHLLKLCPIVSWSQKDVWRYIVDHQLPYNELHDRGYPSIGCTHCTRAVRPGEDERAGRWAGTAKKECGLHTAYKK